MKLEVGKKYRIEGSDKPCQVVALDRNGTYWAMSEGLIYPHHQLVFISEWHDKPDPGEGWRLLHADEDVEQGDEWCNEFGEWIVALGHRQLSGRHYRRRTTPQYVPYTWDDREELRGKWYRKKGDNSEFMVNYVTCYNENDIALGPWRAGAFFKECEWLDGSPCGKKVV